MGNGKTAERCWSQVPLLHKRLHKAVTQDHPLIKTALSMGSSVAGHLLRICKALYSTQNYKRKGREKERRAKKGE